MTSIFDNLDNGRHPATVLTEIEDLIEEAPWAKDTLEGIYETIERTQRVTDGQETAIANIADKVHARGRGRR